MKYKNFLILIAIIATASLTGCRTIRQTLELDEIAETETPQSQSTTLEQRFSESDRSKVEEVHIIFYIRNFIIVRSYILSF